MRELSFPDNSKNYLECSDWMELTAFVSSARRCNVSAVERNLRRLSAYEGGRTTQQIAGIEGACADVLSELRRRADAACDAYPFELNGGELLFVGDPLNHAAYIFCLCLSYFG